jgi:hypothetical protein
VNVTFHTLAALGTAAVLSSKPHAQDLRQAAAHDPLYIQAIGFGAGVVVHGLLDYIPHTYPIKAGLDVMISLVLFAGAILLAHRSHRLLIAVCFLGAIFPDLVDHGPAILSKRMGWPAPTVKIFPWHWPQYSGSIYSHERNASSLFCHLVVLGISLVLLWMYGRNLFRGGMLSASKPISPE